MRTVKLTAWQNGDFQLGSLNDYPDHTTQGITKEELTENLKDLLTDIATIPTPPWHEAELKRTEAEYAAGRLEALDWQEAKTELRNIPAAP